MVRLTRSWSLTSHNQSEDRVHRIGSEIHDSIRIVDYIVEDTVEELQLARLTSKEATAQEVLRDDELLAMIKARWAQEQ
jgi:SNF2 family DNA or RNA helicase